MDAITQAEMILGKRMSEIDSDSVARMSDYFEREGMSRGRAAEIAQSVLRISKECGVGLYLDGNL